VCGDHAVFRSAAGIRRDGPGVRADRNKSGARPWEVPGCERLLPEAAIPSRY
jgi:hypothetical protein